MSTELYDAKDLADEIHAIAGVPPDKNDSVIYEMTLQHIATLLKAMDEAGLTMDEQRRRVGKKKDELIGELIRLREQGTLKGEAEGDRKDKPVVRVHMRNVQKVETRT
jgi:hypothetical protein